MKLGFSLHLLGLALCLTGAVACNPRGARSGAENKHPAMAAYQSLLQAEGYKQNIEDDGGLYILRDQAFFKVDTSDPEYFSLSVAYNTDEQSPSSDKAVLSAVNHVNRVHRWCKVALEVQGDGHRRHMFSVEQFTEAPGENGKRLRSGLKTIDHCYEQLDEVIERTKKGLDPDEDAHATNVWFGAPKKAAAKAADKAKAVEELFGATEKKQTLANRYVDALKKAPKRDGWSFANVKIDGDGDVAFEVDDFHLYVSIDEDSPEYQRTVLKLDARHATLEQAIERANQINLTMKTAKVSVLTQPRVHYQIAAEQVLNERSDLALYAREGVEALMAAAHAVDRIGKEAGGRNDDGTSLRGGSQPARPVRWLR